ncbi:MAG: TIGR03960 family B12-binding radical SAM protein [Clostridia bacterium]
MLEFTRQELLSVQKPARYTGGEYNQVIKDKKNIKCRFAFCFPDIYDIGMSNLGMKILYGVLNNRDDTWCERVFAPWVDFENLMRSKQVKLYALESKESIDNFDMVGFTLQYEMSYTNILNMLDLAGITIYAKDRKENEPFVVAGGPCASNPYPLSDFFDFFMLGEGEELIDLVVEKYIEWKDKKIPKIEYLKSIKDIQGIYIPSLHTKDNIIKKVVINDMDKVYFPTNFVVPNIKIIQDRISLEVFRGCSRGCRFCQAGYIYRPVREKSTNKLIELSKKSLMHTGQNEISLASLSTSDFSDFNNLATRLLKIGEAKKLGISLPSLRIDSINLDILNKIQEVRKSSLTFAPEAGSQRLRDVINKNITKEEILDGCKLAFENGWSSVKLYFMIGLPTETYDDLEQIVELANEIVNLFYSIPKEKRNNKCLVTVSVSTFVPKAHTPFEWFGQNTISKIELKQQYLRDKLKNKSIKYSWHDPKVSMLEATIARGDSKIGDVIFEAFKMGAKFDSFDEMLNYNAWMQAFENCGIDYKEYANKEYDLDYEFPWDNIMHGVTKEFLKREYKKSVKGCNTPRCQDVCSACGVEQVAKCNFLNEVKNK